MTYTQVSGGGSGGGVSGIVILTEWTHCCDSMWRIIADQVTISLITSQPRFEASGAGTTTVAGFVFAFCASARTFIPLFSLEVCVGRLLTIDLRTFN